jgi:hypothetical protein
MIASVFSPSIASNPVPLLRQLGVLTPISFSICAIALLVILEFMQRDRGYALDVEAQPLRTRWAAYALVVAVIVCFRYTGSALDFIYFQF